MGCTEHESQAYKLHKSCTNVNNICTFCKHITLILFMEIYKYT